MLLNERKKSEVMGSVKEDIVSQKPTEIVLKIAPVWRRIISYQIDYLPCYLVAFYLVVINNYAVYPFKTRMISKAASAFALFAYYGAMHGIYAKSIGKMIFRIKVVAVNGGKITFVVAMRRAFYSQGIDVIVFLSILFFPGMTPLQYTIIFGVLSIYHLCDMMCLLFDRSHRSLHDLISGTVVIID